MSVFEIPNPLTILLVSIVSICCSFTLGFHLVIFARSVRTQANSLMNLKMGRWIIGSLFSAELKLAHPILGASNGHTWDVLVFTKSLKVIGSAKPVVLCLLTWG